MQQALDIFKHIDLLFLAILIIGGRYWGGNFFCISKNPAVNFLAFSTAFAVAWIFIKIVTGDFVKTEIENLFITYLVATSFYELLAKWVLEKVEDFLKKK